MKPHTLPIPDAAQIPLHSLACDAREIEQGRAAWLTSDDVQSGEATLALASWLRPAPPDNLAALALYLPDGLEIPLDATPHILRAVAELLRGQGEAEIDAARMGARRGQGQGATHAKAAAKALYRLAEKVEALALKMEAQARGEVELDRRRTPRSVVLDGETREVLAAALCACGGVVVTLAYTKPASQLVCARTGVRVGVIHEGRVWQPKPCDDVSEGDACGARVEALRGVKTRKVQL